MPESGYCTKYLSGINELQENIVSFISWWVKEKKTVIPRSVIVLEMKDRGVKDSTTINALNSLLRKGYIRRCQLVANKVHSSYFVLLRSI